jgi:hypothetical protein
VRPSVTSRRVDFSIEQRLVGPPAAIDAVLLDPAFVAARVDLPKLGGAELLESSRDGDHARQRVRLRFTGDLAPAVTAVIDRDRLTWVDDATYNLVAHTAEHRVVPDHYADRLSCAYRSTVVADGEGSRRTLAGSVRVRMMLVGGKVEAAIVTGLREHAAAEARLIDEWLAGR